MKKLFLILIGLFCITTINSQVIFTAKEIRDKFDDTIYKSNIKTLLTSEWTTYEGDSIYCLNIEEKGKAAKKYVVLDIDPEKSIGVEDDTVEQLTSDAYGKQYAFVVTDFSTFKRWVTTKSDNILKNSTLTYIDRCISSSSYTYIYETEIVWLEKPNGTRTIYYSK